jgi:CRP-like cAMP-binding protein
METLKDIIAGHPFTKDLNPRYLHLLTECASYERFAIEQPIFQESFEADHFYLIHAGRVALQTFVPGSGVTTIQTIGPGEALGWSWLFPPHRWHFTAVALEPTEAVALGARKLRDEMEENHDFGYAIALRIGQLMLERLQATRMRLLELYDVPS